MTDPAQTVAQQILDALSKNRTVSIIWNDQDSAIIAAALDQARREAFEEAAQAVRSHCQARGGSGYSTTRSNEYGDECMYCGVPIVAIRQQAQEPPQGEP